jgi:enoyl-CoA hydratase
MYEGYRSLRFERLGTTLTLIISNPQARNAINSDLHEELPRAFAQVARDRSVRVVVLTGDPAGGAFCAGGDLPWVTQVQDDPQLFDKVMRDGRDIVRNMLEMPQPIIAMINGAALGLGATLALYCDITYMDEAAKIADLHVTAGVVAGDGGAVIWPLLIGPNRAKELLMTGTPLTGRQAAEIGLVNHALPASELRDSAYAMAARLERGPRLAIEWTKRSVNILVQQFCDSILPASMALEGLTFNTPDHREALRAFLAKEAPAFGQSASQSAGASGDGPCR